MFSFIGLKQRASQITSNTNVTLFLILCLALFLRIYSIAGEPVIEVDGTIYARLGEYFSKGAFLEGLRGVFPPFYPFLMGITHIFIPDIELAGRIVSLIMGIVLVYLSFSFLRCFVEDRKALFGAFLIAIHPYLVKASAWVLSESLATTLLVITVFVFYKGLIDNRPILVGLSGFTLSLTYLTRPEYVICLIPMIFLLILEKRFFHILVFVLCFCLLAVPYICFMKVDTGLFVLSKKAIMAKNREIQKFSYHSYLFPVVSIARFVRHIPVAFFDFMNAQLPQFLALAIIGILSIEKRYRILAVLLIIFHVMIVTAVNASSKRFYIEFIPITAPFAVAGVYVIKQFFEKRGIRMLFYYLIMAVFVGVLFLHALSQSGKDRKIHKEAGLFLQEYDPGMPVASRLPFVPFYSRGEWIFVRTTDNCSQLVATAKEKKSKYLIIDDEMLNKTSSRESCPASLVPVKELRDGNNLLVIYRLTDG